MRFTIDDKHLIKRMFTKHQSVMPLLSLSPLNLLTH